MEWVKMVIIAFVFGCIWAVFISAIFEAYFKARNKYPKEQWTINVSVDGNDIKQVLKDISEGKNVKAWHAHKTEGIERGRHV